MFLAADETQLSELRKTVSQVLACRSIVEEREELNLDSRQERQAKENLERCERQLAQSLRETWARLLVPEQSEPQAREMSLKFVRLSGDTELLAARAYDHLKRQELVVERLAGSRLRHELDRVPLWRGEHVALAQLIHDLARYPYLPRLLDPQKLVREAVLDGLKSLSWDRETFAWAECYDEAARWYRGLRLGPREAPETLADTGLLVRPEAALRQRREEEGRAPTAEAEPAQRAPLMAETASMRPAAVRRVSRRYHAVVRLPLDRIGSTAAEIAESVVAHLSGEAEVEVRLDIEARAMTSHGFLEEVMRIVRENGRQLGFQTSEFESD